MLLGHHYWWTACRMSENVKLYRCKNSWATENSSTFWCFHPWHPVCIFFSVGNLWGAIIPWYGDNLTDRPTAFIHSPHYQHGAGISATHMLGFLLTLWNVCLSVRVYERDRTMKIETHQQRKVLCKHVWFPGSAHGTVTSCIGFFTFEVYVSVSVKVNVSQDVLQISVSNLKKSDDWKVWMSLAQTQARCTSGGDRQDSDRHHDLDGEIQRRRQTLTAALNLLS